MARTALRRVRQLLSLPVCDHVPETHAEARTTRCEECGARFNLRVCSTCGHVGCCDSQLAHARVHFHETGHPVMQAKTAVGRGFVWCYEHDRYMGRRAEAEAAESPVHARGSKRSTA